MAGLCQLVVFCGVSYLDLTLRSWINFTLLIRAGQFKFYIVPSNSSTCESVKQSANYLTRTVVPPAVGKSQPFPAVSVHSHKFHHNHHQKLSSSFRVVDTGAHKVVLLVTAGTASVISAILKLIAQFLPLSVSNVCEWWKSASCIWKLRSGNCWRVIPRHSRGRYLAKV